MVMTPRIEPVSPAAAAPVSMLHRVCFPEDPWDVPAVTEIMRIPGFFGQIAWQRDEPAGFVLAIDLGRECEILSLGVVPGERRAGLGTALLNSICAAARQRGSVFIALEVAVDNVAALALYTRDGFTEVGRRTNYYSQGGRRVDALILKRALITAPLAT
jgi:[ribosomal protein S18]-alanine N-acetyltransferase